jgi:benzoyl-CoA reductase subunit C
VKSLEKLLQQFDLAYSSPVRNPFIQKWREQGGGVFGYLCNVPKEIIFAAGLFPVRLLGTTDTLIEADVYFPAIFCHYARSLLEAGARGEHQLLLGAASINMCDTVVHASNALLSTFKGNSYYFINRPHDSGAKGAYTFFLTELSKFREHLEGLTGCKITSEALHQSIQVYNQNRLMLKKIYDLRGKPEFPLLTGAAVTRIAYISQILPPEVNRQLLDRIIELTNEQAKPIVHQGPRIHVSGSILQDLSFFSLVEQCGGMVVSDDLCSGSRHFFELVPETGDPMEQLTNYYLNNVSCPVMHEKGIEERRLAEILAMVKEYRVDGVIFCIQKYCDSHQLDLPYLIECLQKAGIPVLALELDRLTASEQIRSRLSAFFEILEPTKRA